MRTVYVCTDPGVPVFGRKGASLHVQGVLRALLRRGHDVELVAGRTGGVAPRGLEAVRLHLLPPVEGPDAAAREASAQAADAAVRDRLDVLSSEGDIDVLVERYALWGRSGTAWARDHGVLSVLEVNAPLPVEQAAHRALVDAAGAHAVAASALAQADVVACVSSAAAAWARGLAADPERVRVVANGVDTDRVVPRGAAPPAERPFVLGFVGTLRPWHGVPLLADVLALLDAAEPSGYRLLVVGDGPAREDLLDRTRDLGVRHLVELTGALDPEDVLPALHRMDVATAPYPDLPGFYFSPLKIYEYLAAGVPVVASAVGDVPDVLSDGELGLLVPPGDVGALAAAVASLRADPRRRASLATRGRRAAVEQHTWDAVVARLLDALPARAGGV